MTFFRKGAREFMGSEDPETEKKKTQLLSRLNKLGLIESHSLEDVLRLKTEDLLERRLQTIVYRNGLANTIKQARQFVVHGHILVGDRIVNVPSYIIEGGVENQVKLKKEMKAAEKPKKKDKPEENKETKIKPAKSEKKKR